MKKLRPALGTGNVQDMSAKCGAAQGLAYLAQEITESPMYGQYEDKLSVFCAAVESIYDKRPDPTP